MLSQIIGYTLLVIILLCVYYKAIIIFIELYKGWLIILNEKLQRIINIFTHIDVDIWFIYCFPHITIFSSFLLWQSTQNIYGVFIHTFCLLIVYIRVVDNNENMLRHVMSKYEDESQSQYDIHNIDDLKY